MLTYGKPVPIRRTLARIKAVTESDAEAMAASLLRRKPILTALGPHERLESYRDVVARLRG
jgi:hypothetical protein